LGDAGHVRVQVGPSFGVPHDEQGEADHRRSVEGTEYEAAVVLDRYHDLLGSRAAWAHAPGGHLYLLGELELPRPLERSDCDFHGTSSPLEGRATIIVHLELYGFTGTLASLQASSSSLTSLWVAASISGRGKLQPLLFEKTEMLLQSLLESGETSN